MAQINLGHVVGQGVPTGGTAGQVLKKNGSTNFDASWATLNSGNIPVSASDSTTVQQSLAAVKSDMGIVEDGNTATHTIAAGQYVIWKSALYTANTAIPAGTTLSSSNLTAVSDGGLNALNGKIAGIEYRYVSWAYSIPGGSSSATNLKTLVDANMPSGKRFIGFVGYNTNSANVVPTAMRYDNSNYSLQLRNVSDSAQNNTAYVYYLCI